MSFNEIDILHPCMILSFIPAFRHVVPSFLDSVVYRPPITPVVMRLRANILICHAFRFNERKHRKHGTRVHKDFATPLRVKPDYHVSH